MVIHASISRTPMDLVQLRAEYEALPHGRVRYATKPGQQFQDHLDEAIERHGMAAVVEVLPIQRQSVYRIREMHRRSRAAAWPAADELRELWAAYRVAEPLFRAPRRTRRRSEEYLAVHRALSKLLEAGYQQTHIALAAKIPARQLRRYVQAPREAIDMLAALPPERRVRRS